VRINNDADICVSFVEIRHHAFNRNFQNAAQRALFKMLGVKNLTNSSKNEEKDEKYNGAKEKDKLDK
jgi:hypothetical protein